MENPPPENPTGEVIEMPGFVKMRPETKLEKRVRRLVLKMEAAVGMAPGNTAALPDIDKLEGMFAGMLDVCATLKKQNADLRALGRN